MMPSRGASVLRGTVPRIRYAQARSFSSAIQTPRKLSAPSLRTIERRKTVFASSLAIGSSIAVRNLSSATTPAAISQTPTTPAPEVSTPASNSSTISDLDTLNLEDLDFTTPLAGVEHIGYLKELGIDYGIGITSTLQWLVEHFHIWGELPWWGAIAATAVTLRVVTLPLTIRASDAAARATAMAPVLQPFQERMKQAQKEGNQQLASLEMQRWMQARKEAGVSFTAMLVPPIVQAVAGYCGFRLLTKMATLPVPGLRDGGFLWITDLTVPDGYLVLPACMALSVHLLIRLGGETSTAQLVGGMRLFMLYGMPAIIFVITGWQSAALAIWFTAAGAMSMGTGLLLRHPKVRSFFKITPLYKTVIPKPAVSQAFGVPLSTSAPAAAVNAAAPQPASVYMRPRYQAPKIRRAEEDARVIDTTLTHPPSTAPADVKSSKTGVIDQLKTSFKDTVDAGKNFQQGRFDKKTRERRASAAEKAIEDRKNRARR